MRFEPTKSLPPHLKSETRTKLIAANKFFDLIQELQLHLHDEMLIAQTIYEWWANKRRRSCLCYFVRDKAWLNTRNIQTSGPAAKLDDQHIGPYRVAWVFPKNPLTVQLDLPESLKILLVFHVSLLQHEANNLLPRQHQGPRKTVIVSDGAKKLNVNRILSLKYDRRLKPPLLRYFVDWEGDHPSWEPFYLC